MWNDWEAVHQGEFSVWPPDLRVSIPRGQTAQEQLLLWNGSGSDVTYSITLTNNTGSGYSADNSVNGSTVYAWEDISSTGTLLLDVSEYDDNGNLPDASLPAAIAVCWDDLNPLDGGDVYFKEETDRVIVQWEAVERFGGGGTCTFQAIPN